MGKTRRSRIRNERVKGGIKTDISGRNIEEKEAEIVWTCGKNGQEKKTQTNNGDKNGRKMKEKKTEERAYGQNRKYNMENWEGGWRDDCCWVLRHFLTS